MCPSKIRTGNLKKTVEISRPPVYDESQRDPVSIKEAVPIRYVYRPYHPWRHGYRREKIWRGVILTVKILLAAESIWFASCYLREHTMEEYRPVAVDVRENEDGNGEEKRDGSTDRKEEGKGIYGVGFEADSGFFFWFHSRIENSGDH